MFDKMYKQCFAIPTLLCLGIPSDIVSNALNRFLSVTRVWTAWTRIVTLSCNSELSVESIVEWSIKLARVMSSGLKSAGVYSSPSYGEYVTLMMSSTMN